MKNLLLFTLSVFFVLILKQSFSQIVTPYYEVCPNETVEYTISSTYYGEQTYSALNGVFIVPDSVYYTPGDSTGIIFNASSSNNKIKIRWGNTSQYGTLRRYDQQGSWIDQEFEIGISEYPRFAPGEENKIALIGTHAFQTKLVAHDFLNYYCEYSNNITLNSQYKTLIFSNDYLWTYNFTITGDQMGWVRFRTKNVKVTRCNSYSSWDTIFVHRKLNKLIISGNPSLCEDASEIYSLSGDTQSQTYEWWVTNGLEIAVAPPYYYTSNFESTMSSWPIVNHSSTSGLAEIKAVAHATNYVDSEESVKQIWLGDPLPDDFYIIGLDNYGNSIDLGGGSFEVCENQYYTFYLAPIYNLPESHHRYGITDVNFHFDFNYTVITGGYGWVYICVNNISSSSAGLVDVVGCNIITEFLDFGIIEGDCGYYYMTYSPNPSNEYIDISFIDEKDTKDNTNQIKIKKYKNINDGIGDYLIQILDKDGNILKSEKSNTMKTTLNIRDIAPGNYFLHLILGDEKYKQQIIIN